LKTEETIEIPKLASLAQPERFLELFHRFMDDQRSDRLSAMMGSHLVALMLCEIHHAINAAEQTNGRIENLVDSVHVYISKHFHDPISTSMIAAELHYNPDYLERVFHNFTDLSITEAIHKKRIKEARRQLIHEYRNVSEIAYACGFSDSGYFRRIFKRHTDMTPTKFRSLYSQVHMKVG
jgi:YesN/AraC family two-component response regulator